MTTIYKGPDYAIHQRKDGMFIVSEPGQEDVLLPVGTTIEDVRRDYMRPTNPLHTRFLGRSR